MIEFNKCYFIDCLDPKLGLPKLADLVESGKMEKIGLGFPDYPWGVGCDKKLQKGRMYHGRMLDKKENKVYFNDQIDLEWHLEWFELLRIVTERTILVGPDNIESRTWWFRNTKPSGEIMLFHPNGHSSTKVAHHHHFSGYLCYGKFPKRLTTDAIEYTIPWGFLSKEKQIIHPTPKGTEIPLRLYIELQPKSVIDPFSGSGSYCYAAHLLGIPWIGYEIEPVYKKDFRYRFSQKTLGKFSYVIKRAKKKEEQRVKAKEFKKTLDKMYPQTKLVKFTEA